MKRILLVFFVCLLFDILSIKCSACAVDETKFTFDDLNFNFSDIPATVKNINRIIRFDFIDVSIFSEQNLTVIKPKAIVVLEKSDSADAGLKDVIIRISVRSYLKNMRSLLNNTARISKIFNHDHDRFSSQTIEDSMYKDSPIQKVKMHLETPQELYSLISKDKSSHHDLMQDELLNLTVQAYISQLSNRFEEEVW